MNAEPSINCPYKEEVSTHLDRVLVSDSIRQSPRLQRLLYYIVSLTLQGHANRLKGYSIAVDVFDKPADFDPGTSALVRVEMGRLRSKLLEYYSSEGQSEPIRIELPKGNYEARIVNVRKGQPEPVVPTRLPIQSASLARPVNKPSIAVIPLRNLSPEDGQSWFADGLTEDLITDLSKLSGLKVCSRHSSFKFRVFDYKDLSSIATQLGVQYMLHGSARRSETLVRVNVELTDTHTDQQIWAERYDLPVSDFLVVQANVTEKIVSALAVSLTPLEEVRLGHAGTHYTEAHEELMKGLAYYWQFKPEYNERAQYHFKNSICIDTEYAAAYTWLARSKVYGYTMKWPNHSLQTLQEANDLLAKALAIDGLLPEAVAVQSWAHMWSGQYELAQQMGAKAVQLDPNNADCHMFYSIILSMTTHTGLGIEEAEVSLKLNPMPSAFYQWTYGMALMFDDQIDKARAVFERGIHSGPTFLPNHVFLMNMLVRHGELEVAHRAAQRYELIYGSKEVRIKTPGPRLTEKSNWEPSLIELGLIPCD